ncbi:metallophosphoesterase [Salmonella enterica subsp. enterica serovar Newport]|uniref:Serine/threonine protein phosphatase n=1 Tax=Salmonella enterica subsp. enterica serovar Berkeley TaxID=1965103 RepID=A0A636K173_SALET|nr:serine/threonine protein phosphatase [Salmonella enterica]EBQ6006632.1 serine/threonine protein phosphatase [Salmonella enterica subsp. enterica serovar Berkeley]EBV3278190.1 serine/threonine protein phosphatase [Salmonella enterica subsp. enterica serovar Wangata]EBX9479764.1 serine/threonine protein phosphatase [Salmonella enterica subsp. enterica serovar Abony]ECH9120169.1 serine/threonine protein phosphatase [Salmonella enterica subsp. enterica]ECI4645921.1 serine/threonine protein phos
MSPIYHRIDGGRFRKIWVAGDLHGCYTSLIHRLDEVGFSTETDLLISVGDLIDRGTENVECLELLQMPWFRAVRGNHEQMMLDALSPNGNVNHWMVNGGAWFFQLDYDKERLAIALVELVRQLPYIIELRTGGKTIVIAHADYPADEYQFGKELSLHDVIWKRDRLVDAQDKIGGPIAGADHFIFGHTPARTQLTFWNQTYIDTGAVFSGNLTLLQLQE